MIFKKTKIICTLGPATSTVEKIVGLINSGLDLVRLNFSHGDYKTHSEYISNVRAAEKKTGRIIPIILDLSGPKIRTGNFENGKIFVNANDEVRLVKDNIIGNGKTIPVNAPDIIDDLKINERILIDDGKISLLVISRDNDSALCKVFNPGYISNKKGINLPDTNLTLPSITEKDFRDIEFGVNNQIDFFALSFVRSADDIFSLKKIINSYDVDIPVIAKIERPEAITNIDSIIDATDVIMVARGDLGVEVSPEKVPAMQKIIISKCNNAKVPVITATQMLESMISNPTPTRAEASDVANAILDGTDCVMLSAETSVGDYPEITVQMMDRIIEQTEEIKKTKSNYSDSPEIEAGNVLGIICKTAVEISDTISAKAIISITKKGRSPLLLSNLRPKSHIIAVADEENILRKSSILWGVDTVLNKTLSNPEDIFSFIRSMGIKSGYFQKGDKVVAILSYPEILPDSANTIRILDI